jgi:hypothetical protein
MVYYREKFAKLLQIAGELALKKDGRNVTVRDYSLKGQKLLCIVGAKEDCWNTISETLITVFGLVSMTKFPALDYTLMTQEVLVSFEQKSLGDGWVVVYWPNIEYPNT